MKLSSLGIAAFILCAAGCGNKSLPAVDVGSADAASLFVRAIQDGDVSAVQQFLEADPDLVFASFQMGQTALHYAAGANKPQVVRVLIESGADPSMVNDEGVSPLETAQFAGASKEVIDLLSGG